MNKQAIKSSINGQRVEAEGDVRVHLADFLRQALGLTGTHIGCEHCACGVCTVIVDGRPVRSCLMLAVQVHGAVVETVESLGRPGDLSALQMAFSKNHALQCGFCTPGMLITLEALLRANPTPSRDDIRDVLSG